MNSELSANNYIVIPNFISKEYAKKLAEDYEKYCKQNKVTGDSQAPNSNAMYNWPNALELLCESTVKISQLVEVNVIPTYSYIRIYRTGDDLKKHTDRPSCEISVTINLDGDCDWPIYIKKANGSVESLNLTPGDAIIYLGCRAEHWRDSIPGSKYAQVFLHYVESQGLNYDHYFDRIHSQSYHREIPNKIDDREMSPLDYSQIPRDIRDYIKVINNVVPEELCDRILEEYKNDDPVWQEALVGNALINKNVRNVQTIQLDNLSVMHANMIERTQIVTGLNGAMFWVINKYRNLFPGLVLDKHSGFELLRYDEGCFYKEHTDSFNIFPRHLSISLHLNDDYEGGEFGFYNADLKIKAKKGSAVVFPSNFMFPHEIKPVTKGTRFSVITWMI